MKPLLQREFRLALRARGRIVLPLTFYLAVTVMIPFGIGPDIEVHRLAAAGVLWAGALLAFLLPLQHLFQEDMDDGTIDRLAASALPLEVFAFGKIVSSWTVTGIPICLASLVVGNILNMPPGTGLATLLTLLAGTPALCSIGVLGAAITVGMAKGGILAAVIVIPFCVPTLIFGASAAGSIAAGEAAATSIAAVLAISLACIALIPFASAKVLRINLQ